MRTIALLAALAGAALSAAGCRTSTAPPAAIHFTEECVCGTEEGDLFGCTAPCCAQGAPRCANPLCLCHAAARDPGK